MNELTPSQTIPERSLYRLAGGYLVWMQFLSLIISFISATLGLYYIAISTKISVVEFRIILYIFIITTTSIIIILSFYNLYATSNIRGLINFLLRGKSPKNTPELNDQKTKAWREILIHSQRSSSILVVLLLFLVFLPILLYTRSNLAQSPTIFNHSIIGLFISGIGIVLTHQLFLDLILAPIRRLILSSDKTSFPPVQLPTLRNRSFIILISLIILAILLLIGISYQLLENMTLTGLQQEMDLIKYRNQLLLLIGMVFFYSFFIITLFIQSTRAPMVEIRQTLDEVLSGDFSKRLNNITSNEWVGLTIQFNNLLDQFQSKSTNIEKHITGRTIELLKRIDRLQASARLARETTDAHDLQSLLSRTVEMISSEIGYFHAGIYLLDAAAEYAILHSASSEGGKKMIARGYKVEIGPNNYLGIAIDQNRPILVPDTRKDANYKVNQDLPAIRSQIAIPLASRGRVIGALEIQSEDILAFQQEDIELLQSVADQIALAIINVQLIEEHRFTLSQMEAVLSENVRRSWGMRVETPRRAFRYTPTSLTQLRENENYNAQSDENVSKLIVPINLRGQKIGDINIERKGGKNWNDTERSLANDVATQVGLALENSRLLEDAQERALFEQSLSELSAKLGSSSDTESLLSTAVKEFHKFPGVTEVSILLSPPEIKNPKEVL